MLRYVVIPSSQYDTAPTIEFIITMARNKI